MKKSARRSTGLRDLRKARTRRGSRVVGHSYSARKHTEETILLSNHKLIGAKCLPFRTKPARIRVNAYEWESACVHFASIMWPARPEYGAGFIIDGRLAQQPGACRMVSAVSALRRPQLWRRRHPAVPRRCREEESVR